MINHTTPHRERPSEIRGMFNAIAPTYDLLNRLLSFGLDVRWRRRAIALFEKQREGVFLDIAAGSGDVSLDLLTLQPTHVVGVDFAQRMLEVFQEKLARRGAQNTIDLACCDALALPFANDTFDGTIVAFGIRNFSDRSQSLQEMYRVLRSNGLSIILELSEPRISVVRWLYQLYARIGLPLFGKLISRHTSAYRYLPASIAGFPREEEFIEMMRAAGFEDVKALPLTFGAVMIYVGRKPPVTRA